MTSTTVPQAVGTDRASYSDGCYLCKKASDHVVLREGEFQGRRCECGLVYTHPRPVANSVSPFDDHHVDNFYAAPARIRAAWAKANCPGGRLLQVGCGMGHFLLAAREKGFEVTGMEPNPLRAKHVRETLRIPVEQAFLEDHALPPATFDVVYHCDMLSHFADPPAALKSMSKLLRPGGVLCFEAGTLGGISPRWYPWVGGVGLQHHIWLYSRRVLGELFSSAGFDVVAERRYGLAPQVVVPHMLEMGYESIKRLLKKERATESATAGLASSGTPTWAASTPPSRMARYREDLKFFLRYYVGRISPPIGPQTYFFVLKPKKETV